MVHRWGVRGPGAGPRPLAGTHLLLTGCVSLWPRALTGGAEGGSEGRACLHDAGQQAGEGLGTQGVLELMLGVPHPRRQGWEELSASAPSTEGRACLHDAGQQAGEGLGTQGVLELMLGVPHPRRQGWEELSASAPSTCL